MGMTIRQSRGQQGRLSWWENELPRDGFAMEVGFASLLKRLAPNLLYRFLHSPRPAILRAHPSFPLTLAFRCPRASATNAARICCRAARVICGRMDSAETPHKMARERRNWARNPSAANSFRRVSRRSLTTRAISSASEPSMRPHSSWSWLAREPPWPDRSSDSSPTKRNPGHAAHSYERADILVIESPGTHGDVQRFRAIDRGAQKRSGNIQAPSIAPGANPRPTSATRPQLGLRAKSPASHMPARSPAPAATSNACAPRARNLSSESPFAAARGSGLA